MKKVLLLLISLSLLFVLVACNNEEGQGGIESGTLDEEYEGVVNQELDVIYKLTDEEIEKGIAPLELDLELINGESEVEEKENAEEKAEDEDGEDENDESPKPTI